MITEKFMKLKEVLAYLPVSIATRFFRVRHKVLHKYYRQKSYGIWFVKKDLWNTASICACPTLR
jgi:hypothetical protein